MDKPSKQNRIPVLAAIVHIQFKEFVNCKYIKVAATTPRLLHLHYYCRRHRHPRQEPLPTPLRWVMRRRPLAEAAEGARALGAGAAGGVR